jgi:filamentous hemagglutinin family protein
VAGNITVDNTLRAANAGQRLAGPTYGLDEDSGRISGRNLLISLKNFDLDAGETALFFSGQPIRNVITRVTGGTASRINGAVVSQIEGASLYLINPSGLMIGPTATFEINGALHLSTAHALDFADGSRLDTRGGDVATLSTAAPAAFGFLAAPRPITVTGATIAPPTGLNPRNVYSLTGGDIAINAATFAARGGVIALHSGAAPGRVTIPTLARAGSASFTAGGSVSVAGRASLDAANSGSIAVTGGDVTFDNAQADALASASDGRSIDVTAGGTLRISNGAVLSGGSEGAGDSPAINLTAAAITIENGGIVASRLSARDAVAPSGAGGPVTLTAAEVVFRNQGNVQTSTGTASRGADVRVNASRSLYIEGAPAVGRAEALVVTGVQTETTAATANAGAGGDVRVVAPSSTIVQTGILQARSVGNGQAGNITVTGDDLTLDARDFGYTGIASRVGERGTGSGSGGRVSVDLTGDLLLRRGGAISATTFGVGTGGDVFVHAATVAATEVGSGNIDDVSGEPFNGVFARSARKGGGGGRAGSVTVVADDSILLAGRSQISVAAIDTRGGAGGISLSAPVIGIATGGRVTAFSSGGGGGGDVLIQAARINVSGAGTIVTTDSDAAGGNVRLSGDTIVVNDSAVLNANAAGDGGTFTIAPANVVVLGGGSRIDAVANNLPVQTTIDPTATFIKSPDAVINAQNPVLPPDVDVASGLLTFNVAFADASRKLQQDCLSVGLTNFSTFTLEPRGGVAGFAGGR